MNPEDTSSKNQGNPIAPISAIPKSEGILTRALKLLVSPLLFDRIPYLLPVALCVLYLPSGIYGLMRFSDGYAWHFLALLATSVATLCVSYYIMGVLRAMTSRSGTRFLVTESQLTATVWGIYLSCLSYIIVTSPSIALIEAIRGAGAYAISASREDFVKTREGSEVILMYLVAFISSALVPYMLTVLYIAKNRWRHFHAAAFVVTLLPSLEKALIMRAIIPIVVLAVNGKIKERGKAAAGLVMAGVLTLVALSSIASGGGYGDVYEAPVDNPYEMFESKNAADFVANRAIWIPYVTAYDWLRYFDAVRGSKFLYGATSSVFCLFTGYERVNAEREVFSFQWGQGELGTGSSNVVYFVDAYLNFGWTGVILYSVIIAYISHWFVKSKNMAALAVWPFFIYLLAIGPLPGVMFSNGLLILMLMARFLVHPKPRE